MCYQYISDNYYSVLKRKILIYIFCSQFACVCIYIQLLNKNENQLVSYLLCVRAYSTFFIPVCIIYLSLFVTWFASFIPWNIAIRWCIGSCINLLLSMSLNICFLLLFSRQIIFTNNSYSDNYVMRCASALINNCKYLRLQYEFHHLLYI